MTLIGYKNIPVSGHTSQGYRSLMVGITYLRHGMHLEYLEGWINPTMPMDKTTKEVFIHQAKIRLAQQLTLHLEKCPDQPRTWEGVQYG